MRMIIAILLTLFVAFPVIADSPSVRQSIRDGDPRTDFSMLEVDFSASTDLGIHKLGYAFTSAFVGMTHGSALTGDIFLCDLPSPDTNSDGDLSDEENCDQGPDLGAAFETKVDTTRRYYFAQIDTAETGSNVSRLTFKGSWDSVGVQSVVDEAMYQYLTGLDEIDPAALKYRGGTKDYYFSQTTGGLIATVGNDTTGDGSINAPFLSCAKMVELVDTVEGVRIWVDGEDGDWIDDGLAVPSTDSTNACRDLLNGLTPFCDSSRGACAAISALDPNHPFVVDANGSSAGEEVFDCDGVVADTSIVIQNVGMTNSATGVEFALTDDDCKMTFLNPNVVWTGDATDFAFEVGGDGSIVVVGDKTYIEQTSSTIGTNNRVVTTNTSNGVGRAVNDPYFALIGDATILVDGATEDEAFINSAGTDTAKLLVIGPTISGSGLGNGFDQSQNGSNEIDYLDAARVTLIMNGGSRSGVISSTNANDESSIINMYQMSFINPGHGIRTDAGNGTTNSLVDIRCIDCLIDGAATRHVTMDGAAGPEVLSIEYQGYIDEDDVAFAWEFYGTPYNDTDDVPTDLAGVTILSNRYSGDLGTAGTACGHRESTCGGGDVSPIGICNPNRGCRTDAPTSGTYYLPVRDSFGIRFLIPDTTITGFALDRGVIGAN